MNARIAVAGVLAALAAAAFADGPAPATGPTLRAVSSPAGLVLVREDGAASAPAAAPPPTDEMLVSGRRVRVLREPKGGAGAPAAGIAARSAAFAAASPAVPQARVLPDGRQQLVLPDEAPPAPVAGREHAVADIDPARPGTRPLDQPQPEMLYRKAPAPTAAPAAKR